MTVKGHINGAFLAFDFRDDALYTSYIPLRLAKATMSVVKPYPNRQAFTCHLSITAFRFVLPDLCASAGDFRTYLNELSKAILKQLQRGSDICVSNALLNGNFVVRACLVDFRTTLRDVQMLPGIVSRIDHGIDSQL